MSASVAAILLAGLVAGCTGDGGDEPPAAAPQASATPTATEEAEPVVETRARNGSVTGRLGKGDRSDVVRRVAAVVDEWLAAAYVEGEYPRAASSFGVASWPGFTTGAARTARADRDLMSNADIAERIDGLVVRRREITVDVLAVDRTARAATARVRLAFKTAGDLERKVTVTGRVFLTKRDGKWRVFGYDVAKARA